MTTDSTVRTKVLDPTRSFIVQAPAGSGKTELLTQRILRLLAGVERPDQILAITFTKKAAAEMQARLLEALHAAQQPEPETPHKRQTWKLARAVLERDRQKRWNLPGHPGWLQIRTIDSFNARLVQQMPVLTAFGGYSRIAEDNSVLYQAAARRTIAMVEEVGEIGDAVAHLLMWLDNDATRLERMLVDMLGHREQWLPHVAGGQIAQEVLERTLVDLAEITLHQLMMQLEDAFSFENLQNWSEIACFAEQLASPDFPEISADQLADWQKLCSIFFTKDREKLRSRWTKNEGFPATAEGKEKKTQIVALKEQLESFPDLIEAMRTVLSLPEPNYDDAQWQTVEALFQVLRLAQANLMLLFDERGEVDYTEISQRALLALGGHENPTDLALRMDSAIQHILVDEFQDTSHAQFDLLTKLTAGWMPGDGRTLFLVGDPMQSIYRFRQAEVGLFLKAVHEGIGDIALEYRQLTSNFRSRAGIVDWVNMTFSQAFPQQADRLIGAIPYAPSVATHLAEEGADAVTIHAAIERDAETEAQKVLSVVQETLNSPHFQENGDAKIAILVRSRSYLTQIIQQLYQAKIPYLAVEVESLGERPLVRDLLALTRALIHPADREAWIALLRAPWCGLMLGDLEILVRKEQTDAPDRGLFVLMQEEERLAKLSSDGAVQVRKFTQILHDLFAMRSEAESLTRWITYAWRQIGGAAFAGEPGQRETDAFFALLAEMEEGGDLADFDRLRERLKSQNLRSEADPKTRVEVMTIHKSKGLQFDTVILPGLERSSQRDAKKLLHWLEIPAEKQSLQHAFPQQAMELLLAPMPKVGRMNAADAASSALNDYIRKIEQQCAEQETLRLLYVAATRAERRLHLFGSVKRDKNGEISLPVVGSLLRQIWVAVEKDFENLTVEGNPPKAPIAEGNLPYGFSYRPLQRISNWQLPEPPLPVVEISVPSVVLKPYPWMGATLIHVGTVVHRLLHRITQHAAKTGEVEFSPNSDAISRQLRQLGVIREELEEATQRVVRAVKNVLNDPQGRFFLQPHESGKSEWELSAQFGELVTHVTLDRTFVDEQGVRWIIDWKTGFHEGSDLEQFLAVETQRYAPQLQKYGAVLQKMENRPQKLGLYFVMHQVFREI